MVPSTIRNIVNLPIAIGFLVILLFPSPDPTAGQVTPQNFTETKQHPASSSWEKTHSNNDWLIDSFPFKSRLTFTKNRAVLSNGLIRREFVTGPEVATISLSGSTGQELIRAVRPEAEVTIDGIRYEVGGLIGQPNQAFLTDKWIKQLKPNKNSLKSVLIQRTEPVAPFKWKKVRHFSGTGNWPPKGTGVRMDYHLRRIDRKKTSNAAARMESVFARKVLHRSEMQEMNTTWKVHTSKSHPRSSFRNEGKVGEIYTPANSAVYIQQPIPKSVKLMETSIDLGTDNSKSWGPGLALVFKNQETVKLNIRPAGGKKSTTFGLFDGFKENASFAKLPSAKNGKWKLRIRNEEDFLWFEAKPSSGSWQPLGKIKNTFGQPTFIRLGKMDPEGKGRDFTNAGDLVRLKVESLAFYGKLDSSKLKAINNPKFSVSVHYEIYDGIPVICKWISVKNEDNKPISVDRFKTEVLALVEPDSQVETRQGVPITKPSNLHVETDFAFGGFTHQNANRHVVHFRPDKSYKTQVNYSLQTPCLLEVTPSYGPSQTIGPGETFDSFRTYELLYDSSDRERRSLSHRKMYRFIAPWVTENPLMHHLLSSNPNRVKEAIDQAKSVGFEMIILSFGSGFNMENDDPGYLKKWKEVADYAKEKGIELGAYSLLSSRRIGGGNDIVPPKGIRATHGVCPALTSPWGVSYYKKLYNFFKKTGFDLLEHDGPYPGDVDTTARPPYQKGEQDSRWVQWKIASNFYRHCRENGIFVNAPDYYFLSGTNKCGMGYREVNWSLPRAQQIIHTRQNIFDGTWYKTPSMGWMFVPLSQYHGGGAAATIEPLHEHQDHYRRMIQCNLAFGVQACFRGPRLFDSAETKALVKKEVDWFKKYREVLEADVIHGRRADGRNLDWMLHVNPTGKHKGMLVAFNPTESRIKKTISVPLYYTGIVDRAKISLKGLKAKNVKLGRDYSINLPVEVPAGEMIWILLESAD